MANKYDKTIIKNAETRARREWIESALASVKLHLDATAFLPSTVESLGHEPAAAVPSAGDESSAEPHLYLAWSEGQRRSGT